MHIKSQQFVTPVLKNLTASSSGLFESLGQFSSVDYFTVLKLTYLKQVSKADFSQLEVYTQKQLRPVAGALLNCSQGSWKRFHIFTSA